MLVVLPFIFTLPLSEHTRTTTTMPLPTDRWTETAVHLAQCSSNFSTRPAARAVMYSFILLWRKYCINIIIQPTRSDLCNKCDQMLDSLRHSLSNKQRKVINNNYNQHLLKTRAFCDTYNTNITEAEEWKGNRDQILGCLESRVQLSPSARTRTPL